MTTQLSRRRFLSLAGATAAAWALPHPVRAGAATDAVLVVVFQRGAADGLNLVVPHGDAAYYPLRPTIQVAPDAHLDLDGFYGLHPALAPLEPWYRSGDLAIVHAVGSHDPSRSHFDAQDFMDRAAPGDKSVRDGWLARTLADLGSTSAFEAVTIGAAKSKSLVGDVPSLAIPSVAGFTLDGGDETARRAALEGLYGAVEEGGTAGQLLAGAASELFSAIDVVGAVAQTSTVEYPGSPTGAALRDVANLLRADLGVRLVAVNVGGWDHHSDEIADLEQVGGDFAASLAAFYEDLGEHRARTLVLTMTEFGRTAAENGSGGTDHGHASIMMALGGGISGGRVLTTGDWPGLGSGDLYEGRDLAVTTDFRDVYAEVLDRHLGIGDTSAILPDHVPGPRPGLWS